MELCRQRARGDAAAQRNISADGRETDDVLAQAF
jgi:hypothetical protein